jgi:hypothetical protein
VFGEWPSWPPAPQRARADSPFFGRHDRHLRGRQSWFLEREVTMSCRLQLGGFGLSSKRNGRQSHGSLQGMVVHWCARARVDRLQNSVSGFWLKRRTSVAAGVSGRGLALGRLILARVRRECREQHSSGETPDRASAHAHAEMQRIGCKRPGKGFSSKEGVLGRS